MINTESIKIVKERELSFFFTLRFPPHFFLFFFYSLLHNFIIFPPPPHFYCFPSTTTTTTTTFLLFSLHHHHLLLLLLVLLLLLIFIVFPPPPLPPHFCCFPSKRPKRPKSGLKGQTQMWWPDFGLFDSEDDYRTGCWNVSHCQQQQSYSGLRSPGRSNSTYFCYWY